MYNFIAESWFSCKKYMERYSRSCDEKLPLRESLGCLIHFLSCRRCRVSRSHIEQVNRTVHQLGQGMNDTSDAQVRPEFLKALKDKLDKPGT